MENRKTTNYEGDLAFKLTPELEFYAKLCTTALIPTFYIPDTNDQLNSLKTLIRKLDPEFVAKSAIYAREKMYFRTIPLVITVELAKIYSKYKEQGIVPQNDDLIRRLTRRVIGRADEITELLAYYAKANKSNWEAEVESGQVKKLGRLAHGIRKGVADAFEKFDEYQFAKYNRTKQEITLRDALFLVHPPRNSQEKRELYQKIIDDTLETPYTWETQMSAAGQSGRSKKEVWEEMIDSKRLGYMATLRNLRNFLVNEISDEHIEKVCNYIRNPNAVKNSKQLPFRYLTAYRILVGGPVSRWGWGYRNREKDIRSANYNPDHVDMIVSALEDAVKVSIENVPVYAHESVLLATDVSSSMQKPLKLIGETEKERKKRMKRPEGTIIEQYDIGAVLAMMLATKCERAIVGMFGDTWKPVRFPTRDILANANEIHKREGEVGYSTNGYLVLQWAIDKYKEKGLKFDRIMIFTDGQLWDSTGRYQGRGRYNKLWKEYKKLHPEAQMVIFNLDPSGGESQPVDIVAGSAYLISGWSDKIFEVLENLENGESALKAIEDVEL